MIKSLRLEGNIKIKWDLRIVINTMFMFPIKNVMSQVCKL